MLNNLYKMNIYASHLKQTTTEKPRHMALEIQVLAWDRHTIRQVYTG